MIDEPRTLAEVRDEAAADPAVQHLLRRWPGLHVMPPECLRVLSHARLPAAELEAVAAWLRCDYYGELQRRVQRAVEEKLWQTVRDEVERQLPLALRGWLKPMVRSLVTETVPDALADAWERLEYPNG